MSFLAFEDGQVAKFTLDGVAPALQLDTDICIVGSSSRIVGSAAGAEIDRHCEVVRFNYATTRGFEADAGARTTLRFVGQRVHLSGVIFEQFRSVLPGAEEVILTKKSNLEAISRIAPWQNVHVWSAFDKNRRTFKSFLTDALGLDPLDGVVNFRSGVMILLLFLVSSECNCRITMYGFDSLRGGSVNGGHYFGQHSTKNAKKFHTELSIEFEVIDRLIARGYVDFR